MNEEDMKHVQLFFSAVMVIVQWCWMFRLTISGEEETRLKLAAMHQSTSISEDDEPSVYINFYFSQ